MRATHSAKCRVSLCVLICCVWAFSCALVAAQPVAAIQEPATISPGPSGGEDIAGPTTLRDSVRRLGSAAGSSPGQAPPDPGDRSGSRRTQIIVFGAVLLATDIVTFTADAVNLGVDFPESAVPVFGPWIALARYNDVVVNPNYTGANTDKLLFAASGIIQTGCAVMLIRAMLSGNRRQTSSLKNVPNISLVPTARRGFLLSYQTRF